jgi:hypothetical protein
MGWISSSPGATRIFPWLTFLSSPSLLLRCWPCCPLSFLWVSAAGEEGEGGTGEQWRRREKERIRREDSNDIGFKGENLNIKRPKLNYSYLIHPTSESSM